MPKLTKSSVEKCPVFIASQILGKKRAIIVLQELMTPEAKDGLRFNEIQRDLEWITPKVLSQRLTDLVDQEMVSRTVDASVIPPESFVSADRKGRGPQDHNPERTRVGKKIRRRDNCRLSRTWF